MSRQVKIISKAPPRRPLPPDRPLKTPQYDLTFGRRHRQKDDGQKDIPKLQNGKRLKDIVRRLQFHKSANPADFIKHRADYLIAAACHCPDSQNLEDWLPRWAADHLHVEHAPDLDAKIAVAIEVARQDREGQGSAAYAPELYRLSAEEIAELLPTTFDDRQAFRLWTFGACDMTPQQRRTRSKKEKKRKDRERDETKRRAAGAKPHSKSKQRTKPWVPLGVGRTKYYELLKTGKL